MHILIGIYVLVRIIAIVGIRVINFHLLLRLIVLGTIHEERLVWLSFEILVEFFILIGRGILLFVLTYLGA